MSTSRCRVKDCTDKATTSVVLADGSHGVEIVPICATHQAELATTKEKP